MYRDFYTTIAQVLPVLLLALMWDSGYLRRLRGQDRRLRSVDPDGVWFWTKPRVRVYILIITTAMIASTAASVLVLAGVLSDSRALRIIIAGGLIIILGTLFTRIGTDVIVATQENGCLPAQEPIRLFSYGTLRQPEVQRSTFGRDLVGQSDHLVGYALTMLEITDPEVIALSGSSSHPMVVPTGNPLDYVPGIVFELTETELDAADAYEVDDYTRVKVQLASGIKSWVYMDKRAVSQEERVGLVDPRTT